ncbi:hypothetical protein BDZ97DRAFT_1829379 [Flammula alnicola]|nr:hypothetical protein BDZ97DRAFT_1829379 [Flammula alnicola]
MSKEGQAIPEQSKTAFISGPIEPSEDYFFQHYEPQIKSAISAGHSFVMGPASGMDTMALQYLIEQGVHPSRITVYFAEFQERDLADLIERFKGLGGNIWVEGVTTSDRDAAMTRDSDYDILRYMPIEEQKLFYGARYYPRVTATEKNERRRKGLPLHVNHELVEWEVQRGGQNILQEGGSTSSGWRMRMRKVLGRISNRPR